MHGVVAQQVADNAADIIGAEYFFREAGVHARRREAMRWTSSRASRALGAGPKSASPSAQSARTWASSLLKVAVASLAMIKSTPLLRNLARAWIASCSVSAAKPTQKGR